MKKLRLAIEALAAESFMTSGRTEARGTVRAHATEFGASCDLAPSCGPETCGNAFCIRHTDNVDICGGGTGGCSVNCTAPSGQLSCAGCTAYDVRLHGGRQRRQRRVHEPRERRTAAPAMASPF